MVESNGRDQGIQQAAPTFDIPAIFFAYLYNSLILKSEKVKLKHKMQL